MNRKTRLSAGLGLAFVLVLTQGQPAWPCSGFTAHDEQTVLVGTNEDYYSIEEILFWFVPPEQGRYGHVTFGYPIFSTAPQGGLNDQGLFWDGFATPQHTVTNAPDVLPFTVTTMDEVLETSATVDEAIINLRKYDLRQWLGTGQLFFVDKHGDSAIVEGDVVHRPAGNFQYVTNFLLSDPEAGNYPCWRYEILEQMIDENSELSMDYFSQVAEAVSHQGTISTFIADLKAGTFTLFHAHDYTRSVAFDLEQELLLGPHEFLIAELFSPQEDGMPCAHFSACLSGHCVDGLCCDTGCANTCQSCAQPGSEGTCLDFPDGTSCADPDVCNGDEVCSLGRCVPVDDLTCDDGIACTSNSCDRTEGCLFEPQDAECDDGQPCTQDTCDAADGCQHEPLPDGTACEGGGACRSAVCQSADQGGCGCASSNRPAGGGLLILLLLGLCWRGRSIFDRNP